MNFTTSEMELLEKKLGCYFKLIEFTTVNSTESLLNSRDVNVDLIYTFLLLIILNIAANSLLILGIMKTNKKLNSGQKLFIYLCLLYTSPSPRDKRQSRMPSSA